MTMCSRRLRDQRQATVDERGEHHLGELEAARQRLAEQVAAGDVDRRDHHHQEQQAAEIVAEQRLRGPGRSAPSYGVAVAAAALGRHGAPRRRRSRS